jgi:hypothetical protein
MRTSPNSLNAFVKKTGPVTISLAPEVAAALLAALLSEYDDDTTKLQTAAKAKAPPEYVRYEALADERRSHRKTRELLRAATAAREAPP